MADQASGTEANGNQGGAQAAQPTTTAPQAPAQSGGEDIASLKASLARAESELEKTRKEAAGHRNAKNEARTAAEKALEEQGQYKALADERAKRLAELESLEGPAKRWAEHEARVTASVAAAREALTPEWKAALDAAQTLDGKQAILSALEGTKATGKQPPAKAPPGGGPPASPAAEDEDWQSLADSPTEFDAAIARNPAGWQRFSSSVMGPPKTATTFDVITLDNARKRAASKSG